MLDLSGLSATDTCDPAILDTLYEHDEILVGPYPQLVSQLVGGASCFNFTYSGPNIFECVRLLMHYESFPLLRRIVIWTYYVPGLAAPPTDGPGDFESATSGLVTLEWKGWSKSGPAHVLEDPEGMGTVIERLAPRFRRVTIDYTVPFAEAMHVLRHCHDLVELTVGTTRFPTSPPKDITTPEWLARHPRLFDVAASCRFLDWLLRAIQKRNRSRMVAPLSSVRNLLIDHVQCPDSYLKWFPRIEKLQLVHTSRESEMTGCLRDAIRNCSYLRTIIVDLDKVKEEYASRFADSLNTEFRDMFRELCTQTRVQNIFFSDERQPISDDLTEWRRRIRIRSGILRFRQLHRTVPKLMT